MSSIATPSRWASACTVLAMAAFQAPAAYPPADQYVPTRVEAVEGGLVYGVDIHRKSHQVFVAAETMRGGIFGAAHNPANGTWTSKDLGRTWQRIGPGGRNVKVSQSDPDVIYANSTYGGLFRTDDGGANWRTLLTKEYRLGYRGLDVFAGNHDIVYAGGPGKLFVTRDGGATWETFDLPQSEKGDSRARIQSIHIHPTNPDIVLFGFYDSSPGGVWKTTDGGKTFQMLYRGNARGMNVSSDFQSIYCSAGVSHDGGQTWQKVDAGVAWCIVVHPKDPKVAFYSAPGGAVRATINGGETFFQIQGVARNYDGTEVEGLAIDAELDILWAGGDFIWRGDNASAGKVRLVRSDKGFHVISLADIQSTPHGVWACSDAQGIHYTKDGQRWITTAMGMHGTDAMHRVAPSPTNPLICYSGQETRLFKTVDGGKTWFNLYNAWFPFCLIDSVNPDIIYVSSHSGTGEMLRSVDGGSTWEKLGRGRFVAVHPSAGGVVYVERTPPKPAADGEPQPTPADPPGMYISRDAARSFVRLGERTGLGQVLVSRVNPEVIYSYSAPGANGLFRSDDGGRSWQKLELVLGGPGRLAEAGDGSIWLSDLGNGLVRSTDRGATWEKIWDSAGPICSDPWDVHSIYMATRGGIWRVHPKDRPRAELPVEPPPAPAVHQVVEFDAPMLVEQSNTTYRLTKDLTLEGLTRSLILFNRGLRDIVIDGGGHTVTVAGAAAIFGDDLENVTIRNLRFVREEGKSGGNVIQLFNCRNLTISGCKFPLAGTSITTRGIFTDNVVIEDCELVGRRNTEAVYGTGRHTLRGCTIDGNVKLLHADGSIIEKCTFIAGCIEAVGTSDLREIDNVMPPPPPQRPGRRRQGAGG